MFDISCIIFSKKLIFIRRRLMSKQMARHFTGHTNVFELHTLTCSSHTRSTPNFHKNLELIVVYKGECRLFVADVEYLLTEGQAAFIMPYQIHHFEVVGDGLINCTTLHESLISSAHKIVTCGRPDTPVFTPSKSTYDYFCCQIIELFGNNSREQKSIDNESKRMKVKGLLYSMISEFIDQVTFSLSDDFENITTAVLGYVTENFRENISLKDVAKNTGYNYQYISRTFNTAMGMSFKQLLNMHRMEYALSALRRSDLPIIDIAYESGFQSVRSFYRVCLEIFGCTPLELRKRGG